MLWEKKLLTSFLSAHDKKITCQTDQDIKALVLNLISKKSGAKGAVEIIRDFVTGFEKLQFINKQVGDEFGKYLLPFPVLFNDSLKLGQMLIDLGCPDNSGEARENNLISVCFLLEMSNLGEILADFSILNNSINGSFSVGSSDVRNFIEVYIPDLIKMLETHNFKVGHIKCSLKSPALLAGISLVDRMIDNRDGELNIVI